MKVSIGQVWMLAVTVIIVGIGLDLLDGAMSDSRFEYSIGIASFALGITVVAFLNDRRAKKRDRDYPQHG